MYLPHLGTMLGWGNFKLQYKLEPSKESLVHVVNEVGSEDNDSRESLNVIQQHSHIHVGIAISRCTANTVKTTTISYLLLQAIT